MRDNFEPLSQAEWITAANPLTADIRALFSGHGFEIGLGGVGPWEKVVDDAIGMAVDDLAEHVGEIGVWIDAAELTILDQRGDDCPVLAASI